MDYRISIQHERATEKRAAMVRKVIRKRAEREQTLTRRNARKAKYAAQGR